MLKDKRIYLLSFGIKDILSSYLFLEVKAMNGHVVSIRKKRQQSYFPMTGAASRALYLLSGYFFAGSLLGCLLSVRTCGGEEALFTYLKHYLEVAKAGVADAPGILAVIWEVFRYPLACFLLNFLSSGRWMIPGVLAARGFFLSFAVSAFVHSFGKAGLYLAAGVFLPSAMAELSCMILWGLRCLNGKGEPLSLRAVFPLCGICVGILLCAVLYECCFASSVLGALATFALK